MAAPAEEPGQAIDLSEILRECLALFVLHVQFRIRLGRVVGQAVAVEH